MPRRRPSEVIVLAAALGLAAAGVGASVATPYAEVTVGLAAAVVIVAFVVVDTRRAVVLTMAFAVVLGFSRRLFGDVTGAAAGDLAVDPLLAVLPVVTLALFAVAARAGALGDRSPLARVVLALCVAALVAGMNPLQGPVVAWPLGLMIFLTPVLWFWIGRGLVDDDLARRVLRVVLVGASVSAVYGLAQTGGWFLGVDQRWLDSLSGYVTIRVSSFVRGFGFASSAAEYGKLLAAGMVVAVAATLARSSRWPLLVLPVLAAALFLSGLRTTLVLTVVAVGVLWGARRRAKPVRLLAYGCAAATVLYLVAASVAPTERARTDAATVLAQRQVSGLGNPLDPRASTLHTHVDLVARALRGTITDPVGTGTATITIAGKRFGESEAGDVDIADAAIAFGVVGVVLYVALGVRLVSEAYALAIRRRDALALAALGVVIVSSLQWLNGGLYGVNAFAWCIFGWIDRASSELRSEDRATAAAGAP